MNAKPNKPTLAEIYYANEPTCAELCAILGPRWAICRDTPKNRERYGRCITRREYAAARKAALAARPT